MFRMLVLAGALAIVLGAAPPPLVAEPFSPSERTAAVSAVARFSGRAETDVGALADDDLRGLVLETARTELGQRIRPSQVDRFWALEPPRRDVAAEFAAARADGTLAAWLGRLTAAQHDDAALRAARARYGRIVAAGGWPALPPGPTLRPGDRGPEVARLRERLGAEYALAGPRQDDPLVLDEGLASALRAFQRLHDLTDDGVLGPETRRALNIPAETRLDQIDANLERDRWLPRPMPQDRFEVDVGGAEATLFAAGRAVLNMRAVVGDPRRQTPMFASRITAIVFNPVWNVPPSIAANEILLRARREPGYLQRNGFSLRGGKLEQAPGPKNALGVVKFDLPSPFGVYLHDTPARSAFARPVRALSHGCMRLEKPRELAAALLARQGGSRETVEAYIADGTTRRVGLREPLALFVVYRTTVVTETGEIVFRPDVYGWDAQLAAALRSGPVEHRDASADTDCRAAAR